MLCFYLISATLCACHYVLFFLSPFPECSEAPLGEGTIVLFCHKRDFVILHVLGYYQHQCSNVRFNLLPIGLHLSSLSSNGNSSALPSSIGRMWFEARSDEMTE